MPHPSSRTDTTTYSPGHLVEKVVLAASASVIFSVSIKIVPTPEIESRALMQRFKRIWSTCPGSIHTSQGSAVVCQQSLMSSPISRRIILPILSTASFTERAQGWQGPCREKASNCLVRLADLRAALRISVKGSWSGDDFSTFPRAISA